MQKYTISEFMQDFPNEEACFNYLIADKVYPCKCGLEHKYRIKNTKRLACSCGHQISPFKGTIIENSSTALSKWLFAIYLFSQSRNGVSAKELQRQLGVTYKCAWRMGHQIRTLMKVDNEVNTLDEKKVPKLRGVVEADEAYFGGNSRYDVGVKMTGRGTAKSAIFGMVERGGKVKAHVVPNVNGSTLMEFIACNIKMGSRLITDEFRAYKWAVRHGLIHLTINHGKRHYGYKVAGFKIHTNFVEGFWSIFKNGIRGTHRWCSRIHLQSYLNCAVFYYNRRNDKKHLFHTLLERVT